VWVNVSGYAPANPYSLTFTAAGSVTYTLAAAPPPTIFQTTVNRLPTMTAHDLQERLMDFVGGDPDVTIIRGIRRAILDAMREFATASRWTYLRDVMRLALKGPYSTGTVSYDASTHVLTLTGGTWPEWAADGGQVMVGADGDSSPVDIRLSATQLRLRPPLFVGSFTDQKYELFKPSYLLPSDFVAADNAMVETCWGRLRYLPLDQLQNLIRQTDSRSTPLYWTLAGRRDANTGLVMMLYPPPDTSTTADIVYYRSPLRIRHFDVNDGLATVLVGSPTTVTFSKPIVKDDMLGAILRLSSDRSRDPGGLESVEPAVHEAAIRQVISSTQVVIDVAVRATLTEVAYRISDPIEVEEILALALARCAEKNYALSRILKTQQQSVMNYNEALIRAKEADSRVSADRGSSGPYVGSQGRVRTNIVSFTPDE
jgi:hypothetical protein